MHCRTLDRIDTQMQERLLSDELFNFRHARWCLFCSFLNNNGHTTWSLVLGLACHSASMTPDNCKIPRQIRSSAILAANVLNPSAVSRTLTSTKACDPNEVLMGPYSRHWQLTKPPFVNRFDQIFVIGVGQIFVSFSQNISPCHANHTCHQQSRRHRIRHQQCRERPWLVQYS